MIVVWTCFTYKGIFSDNMSSHFSQIKKFYNKNEYKMSIFKKRKKWDILSGGILGFGLLRSKAIELNTKLIFLTIHWEIIVKN